MAFHVITPLAHGTKKPTKAEVTACLILLDMLKPHPPSADLTEKPATTIELSGIEETTPFPPPRPPPPPPPPPRPPPQSINNIPQTFSTEKGPRPVPLRPHVSDVSVKPEVHTCKPSCRRKKPHHKDSNVDAEEGISTVGRNRQFSDYHHEAINNKAVVYTDTARGETVYYEYNAKPADIRYYSLRR